MVVQEGWGCSREKGLLDKGELGKGKTHRTAVEFYPVTAQASLTLEETHHKD